MSVFWSSRPELMLFLLVSSECILGFLLVESIRVALFPASKIKPQYWLALAVGVVVYAINAGNVLLQHKTGVALPSLGSTIDNLVVAVLLFPLMAAVAWVGILDARGHVLQWWDERRRSHKPRR
jgi:hypothetical protein